MENSLAHDEVVNSRNSLPLGEILIEAGLISASQLEIALQQQNQDPRRIGEILASHNWIKQQTADFFVEQWQTSINQKQKKPLVYYFRQSGLLDEIQIAFILEVQKQQAKPTRFHRLAVEKGYIKQLTVDFFLSNIFQIYHSNVFSFAKPYELLTRYNKGQTNFRRTDLNKAPLIGVSLKGIHLDGSNLREANLTSSNLTNSSLKQTDLALTNLNKAILTKVNFEKANLYQANLREAHLQEADFTQANLKKSDLRKAYLFQTIFAKADLRNTKLPQFCSYKVFYDSETIFDDDFDPQKAGWTEIETP